MQPLFIAEIGLNHQGNLNKAFRMVDSAKAAGAHIAKFQFYSPIDVLGRENPALDYAISCQLTRSEHEKLRDHCHRVGIEYLVSIFDLHDILWADSLCKRHKIASRMNQNQEFIAKIEELKKPVIMSIQPELTVRRSFRDRFYFMWCVRDYPATKEKVLRPTFSYKYGLSSHCPDYTANVEAYRRGARIFENHVCESREETGCDIASSLTFEEYAKMTNEIKAMGLK